MDTNFSHAVAQSLRQTSALFHAWNSNEGFDRKERDALIRLHHAAQEWILTLTSYSTFHERPRVLVALETNDDGFLCTISDNSDGMPCAKLARGRVSDEAQAAFYMIRLLADRISYRRGSRSNIARLRVSRRWDIDAVAANPECSIDASPESPQTLSTHLASALSAVDTTAA